MAELKGLKRNNREEATLHLFTKLKYDLAINVCFKLMQLIKQSKDKVVFQVGKDQRAYPASLVKTFTNIRSSVVTVNEKYDIQELMNLFDILMNLPDYKCMGLTQNYSDWKPVGSLVNMTELAGSFGMEEVQTFLKCLPELFTDHNKNAYDNEIQRREKQKKERDQSLPKFEPQKDAPRRGRSRSRTRSLSQMINRSLSRGRKGKQN